MCSLNPKSFIVFLSVFCISQSLWAKTEYYFLVQFHDKQLNYKGQEGYKSQLTEKAIERRARYNIKYDSADLPVTEAYLANIKKQSIQVKYVSRWLNGAVITTQNMDTAWRLKIKFFVKDVVYLGKYDTKAGNSGSQSLGQVEEQNDGGEKNDYGKGLNQLEMINGLTLHNQGYKGQGMTVAVFDAGFKKVNELSLFEHLYASKRVKYTYDLIDFEQNVYDDDDHGLHVLGCLAAQKSGTMIGSAPQANYVLIRTESATFENLIEEINWVRAAEIADSLGVDVISSSLGYNHFDEKRLNHSHDELDGKTTFISIGAKMAALKGMLVVNSAGNDGNKSWGRLDFPADVEEILVVGAVDSKKVVPAFSSPGPTADFRIKPDVCALGQSATITTTFGVGTGNGTSYSCPIIAGMMTCLWQANNSLTPAELISLIRLTGHISLNPQNDLGYGVPDYDLALAMAGKHSKFDYAKVQLINYDTAFVYGNKEVAFYTPNNEMMYCDVIVQKKILFFKYQKTVSTAEAEPSFRHFGKIQIYTPALKEGIVPIYHFYYFMNGNDRVEL